MLPLTDKKGVTIALKICAALAAVCTLLLTFTVSDYYIFNRFSEYGFFFCISQWFKKAGLLLLLLAVFFRAESCGKAVKYFLPLFVVLSCFLFGDFFDAAPTAADTDAEIYNSVNLFFPKWLNIATFFVQNALYLACCALLFVRDGFRIGVKQTVCIAPAIVLTLPLNLFENFFDIDAVPQDSFLRFRNFTVWHLAALLALVGVTLGLYYYLRNKPRAAQDKVLAALAISLLIQYHCKDSMVLADGYNVYHTVFACLPLFICNIGVYIASVSVMAKKKILYAISFFIHAVGALTVFVYFGKDEMSNYGIFCSYSILYFCFTHCFLFALCVLPSALKHYAFRIKDCLIPLVYYFVVILVASVASALVSSASLTWTAADGSHLTEPLKPNYAFTQVNPLPFEVPPLAVIRVWLYDINVLYVLGLYATYVGLFFAFYGLYRAFLAVRKRMLARTPNAAKIPAYALADGTAQGDEATDVALGEAAVSDPDGGDFPDGYGEADAAESAEPDPAESAESAIDDGETVA